MRLREMQWILNAAIPDLNVGIRARESGGNRLVVGITATRGALNLLTRLDALRDGVAELLRGPLGAGLDEVSLPLQNANEVVASVESMKKRARLLLDALEQALPEERPDTFSIEFPLNSPISLKELRQEVEDIETIFEQPLFRLSKTQMGLAGVDSGSMVFDIALTVGASAIALGPALKVLSKLYEAAKDFMLFLRHIKRQDEENRMLRLQGDLLEKQVQLNAARTDAKLKLLTEGVVEEFPAGGEEGFHNALAKSIKMLAEKLDKGVTLKLASNLPESIVAVVSEDLLPPMTPTESSSADPVPLKQLTDGSTGTDDSQGDSGQPSGDGAD
jgi:hypothetical protein